MKSRFFELLTGITLALCSTAGATVLVEGYSSTPINTWSYESTAGNESGMVWNASVDTPGIRFSNRWGVGSAWAPVALGTQPFSLESDVYLTAGNAANWRLRGVCIGLTTAAPPQMTADDYSIIWALYMEGPSAQVRRGPLFRPNGTFTDYLDHNTTYRDNTAIPRGVINAGGAGGHMYSYLWPGNSMAPRWLHVSITRDATDSLVFTVSDRATNLTWWKGGWKIPAGALITKPFTHCVVRSIRDAADYTNAPMTEANGYNLVEGIVSHIAVTTANENLPSIAAVSSIGAITSGSTISLSGNNFAVGTTVLIDGQSAPVIQLTATQIKATVPSLPNGKHTLQIRAPNGYIVVWNAGITYGRALAAISPAEVSVKAGDTVTVYGAGFNSQTAFFLDGTVCTSIGPVSSDSARILVPAVTNSIVQKITARWGATEWLADTLDLPRSVHPSLFIDAAGLAAWKSRLETAAFSDYRAGLLADTTAALAATIIDSPDDNNYLHSLLTGYLLTGSPTLRKKLIELSMSACNLVDLSEFMLHNVGAIAVIYDCLFNELTNAQRSALAAFLERGVKHYLNGAGNTWWIEGNPSNTIAVGNCWAGLAGIALYNCSANGRLAVDHSWQTIRNKYRAIESDGACVEGTLYWDYGFTHQLILGHALKFRFGDDHGLLDGPALRAMPNFLNTMLGGEPKGYLLTFNSTQPFATGGAICADLGSRFGNQLMLWYADQLAYYKNPIHGPLTQISERAAFFFFQSLWRPQTPAPGSVQFPGVSTLATLSKLNCATLRSQGTVKPDLMVAIKGRNGQTTHHNQPDHGSFIVYAKGQNFLIDPGYNQNGVDKHSIPLINGMGPDAAKKALITSMWENSTKRHVALDVKDSYSALPLAQGKRLYTLVGSQAIIILDDLVLATPSDTDTVTAQYQCMFKPVLDANGTVFDINGDSADVAVRCFGPSIKIDSCDSMPFGNSWIFKKLSPNWWRVQGNYAPQTSKPLVTVLLPHAKGSSLPASSVAYTVNQIVVTLPDNTKITYSYGVNGWELPAPNDAVQIIDRSSPPLILSGVLSFKRNALGTVISNGKNQSCIVQVMTLNGRAIKKFSVDPGTSKTIGYNLFAQGIYLVSILSGKEKIVERIMVR